MSKAEKITVPIDICVATAERHWFDSSDAFKLFAKKSQEILKFHVTKDVSIVNNLISEEGAMFEPADIDTADELRYDLKFMKEGSKGYLKTTARIKKLSTRQPNFSSTVILAFVYRIIKTYPEMIPLIDNAMFVERAIKYMEGSYIDRIAKLMKGPSAKIEVGKNNLAVIYNRSIRWFENVLEMMCNMFAQYGATGDEKYISAMDEWPLFQCIPLHHEVLDITPEYFYAEIKEWYFLRDKEFKELIVQKYGFNQSGVGCGTIIGQWSKKNFAEYMLE